MKYLKLFENFEDIDNFDIEELEDILISMSDYGFSFDDVYIGSAIKMNRDYVDNSSYFSINSDSYKHFSIKFKSQDYCFLNENFFEDLKYIVEHVESRYNVELHCIFTSGLKHVYYKNLDVFKSKLRETFPRSMEHNADIRVKYNRLELMFEIK